MARVEPVSFSRRRLRGHLLPGTPQGGVSCRTSEVTRAMFFATRYNWRYSSICTIDDLGFSGSFCCAPVCPRGSRRVSTTTRVCKMNDEDVRSTTVVAHPFPRGLLFAFYVRDRGCKVALGRVAVRSKRKRVSRSIYFRTMATRMLVILRTTTYDVII